MRPPLQIRVGSCKCTSARAIGSASALPFAQKLQTEQYLGPSLQSYGSHLPPWKCCL